MYKHDFDRVEFEFAQLFYDITAIIKEAQVTLDDLKKLLSFFDDLEIPLQPADTIAKVMRVIQKHSSFVNCDYLKYIAEHFIIPAAKNKIEAYYLFVENFCQYRISLHSYMTSLLDDQSRHLLSSGTIMFKLEWTPSKKALVGIQSLLRKTLKYRAIHVNVHVVMVGIDTVCKWNEVHVILVVNGIV